MMGKLTYDPVTLIKEYTARIKDGYSLTDDQISEICKYQFLLTRREVESGSLRTVRIKYFGSFKVFRSRAISILNKIKKAQSSGRTSQEHLDKVAVVVENFLKEEENGEDSCTEDAEDGILSEGHN